MYYIALEKTTAYKAERFDEGVDSDAWEPIASAQAPTEKDAKVLILESVLEMLNDESLLPTNEWVRLKHYNDTATKVTKVEVF